MQETQRFNEGGGPYNPQNAVGGPGNTRSRDVSNTGAATWGGMGTAPSALSSLRNVYTGGGAQGSPYGSGPTGSPLPTDPPTGNPGAPGNTPTSPHSAYGNPATGTVNNSQPISLPGMVPGGYNAYQAQGTLAPEYANMQQNVQAGIAKNSQKPAGYNIATNDPNVWMNEYGGTWITPGYSYGDKSSQVFGTNPSLNIPIYDLPGGTYWQNPNEGAGSGALSMIKDPKQAIGLISTLNQAKGQNPYGLLAGAMSDKPITTAAQWEAAQKAGKEGYDKFYAEQNKPAGGTGGSGTETPATPPNPLQDYLKKNPLAANANQQQLQQYLQGMPPELRQQYINQIIGNNPQGQLIAAMLNGSNIFTSAATGSTPATGSGGSTPSTPATGGGAGKYDIVEIGGQKMKWNPATQNYNPINPIPYGMGGGEAS